MRFSYAESMTDPSFYAPLAQAAEEAGYDTFLIPDSICYPAEADTKSPYNADGTREFLEDKPFIEPFSLVPALGAVTTTFTTSAPHQMTSSLKARCSSDSMEATARRWRCHCRLRPGTGRIAR